MANQSKWPPLPYDKWKDTLDTLHMWVQIIGKIKLSLSPFLNHWWNVTFSVTSTGMNTGLIPYKDEAFGIDFNFIHHNLTISKTDGQIKTISLIKRPVAEFYKEVMSILSDMNISVNINPLPCEVSDPIPCDTDTLHSHYIKDYVTDWWHLLVRFTLIFERFRSPFRGKSSPVHFFWGSFDLNETRYSGKPAIPPDYGGQIMKYAENEENFSFGFWPGDQRLPEPAFYAYIYPAPKGIEAIHIKPDKGYFNTALGEFILHYEDVRTAPDPEKLIMDFLQSTYLGCAEHAGWDIKALEGPVPKQKPITKTII